MNEAQLTTCIVPLKVGVAAVSECCSSEAGCGCTESECWCSDGEFGYSEVRVLPVSLTVFH